MKYRKKPVVIEATPIKELLLDTKNNWSKLPKWVVDAYDKGNIVFADSHVIIKTLEGKMVGERDDMLIQGVAGELYPVKSEIFHNTYESTENSFKDRLLLEHADLGDKLTKLRYFLSTEIAEKDSHPKSLLIEQEVAMTIYYEILEKRINLLKELNNHFGG